jgi:exodeoxyribonuclease VIII
MKPGVYEGISNAEYHGGPGISKSGLDLIHRSPMHYHAVVTADNDHTPTPAQELGTAAHALILEPEVFTETYCLALRRSDVPEAIEEREVLVEMVEAINQERIAAHPDAVRDTETLVAMIGKLNETRLAKLSTSGNKDALIDRIVEFTTGWGTREELEAMKGAELKAFIERVNESRTGLLSTSGSRTDLANTLRANGVDVVLWSEITDAYQQEHGRPYILSTSTASRHEMAAWLAANGKNVRLWSDVLAEWTENNPGRIVLSPEVWDQLHAMRDAVHNHPAAHALLTSVPGEAEKSVYWIDPTTGVLCRCRPDWWRDDYVLVDVKTTDDASPEGFAKSMANWRYDVQAPYYMDGVKLATGRDVKAFVFIAVEKKPPYAVGVYVLDSASLELGRAQYQHDLRVYAECLANDNWPGYGDKIQTINMPAWHANKNAHLIGAA